MLKILKIYGRNSRNAQFSNQILKLENWAILGILSIMKIAHFKKTAGGPVYKRKKMIQVRALKVISGLL